MLRGVSRQMIVVKDVGNDLFEQAIFIVNPGKQLGGMSQDDMAAAAREIVNNYIKNYGGNVKKLSRTPAGRKRTIRKYRPLLYLLGVLCCAALVTVLVFL